jgi:hypothetical protein
MIIGPPNWVLLPVFIKLDLEHKAFPGILERFLSWPVQSACAKSSPLPIMQEKRLDVALANALDAQFAKENEKLQ